MNPPPNRDPKSSSSRLRAPSTARLRALSTAEARAVPPRSRSKGKVIAAAFIAGAVVLAIAGIALNSSRPKREAPPEVIASKAPEPRPADPPPVAPKPPAPPPRRSDPPPLPNSEEKFRERLAEARKKALERVDEARREVAQERTSAGKAAAEVRARLARRPLTLTLRDGETIRDAIVRSFTMQSAEVSPGGSGDRTLLWDSVDPASLPAAADLLFEASAPAVQFDRGRFFIARRMWKSALEGFDRAAKLGEGYETRVLEFRDSLARLASGQGAFRGSARRTGQDQVLLRYDFREASQLQDWTKGLTLAGTAAVLEAPGPAGVALVGGTEPGSSEIPVLFAGELDVETRLTSSVPLALQIFLGPQGGYELEIGPAGAALFAVDPEATGKDRRREVQKTDRAKLATGSSHSIRLRAKLWKFSISIDRQESVTLEDVPSTPQHPPRGLFGISIPGGRLSIDGPIVLQGRVPRDELDTRMGDTEVLVRRALDPELEEIHERQVRRIALLMLGETGPMGLTADDPYFLDRITLKRYEDYSQGYERAKREFAAYLEGSIPDGFTLGDWEKRINTLIGRYPDVPGLYYLRALYHHERQNGAPAQADVRKALELFPEFAEALLLLAEDRLEAYDFDGALSLVNRVLDAKPDSPAAYVLRARASFARSPAAPDAFEEDLAIARKLDPADSQAIYFQRVLLCQLRGPRELGCRFEQVTPHYRVTSDISAEASARYAASLEAVWEFFAAAFKDVPRDLLRPKPRVAVFQTAENYHTYFELLSERRGDETLGVFRRQFNELVLFDTADRTETLQTLFHEQFHQFMSLMTPETPPFWYNEGMAEYMSAITVENGKVAKKGQILRDRFWTAKLMVEVDHVIPFEKIMCETPREFYGSETGLKYAQSWAMVHFFHEYAAGKYRPLIDRYFREIKERRTPREAYEDVFRDKVADLEKEWKEYVKKLKP